MGTLVDLTIALGMLPTSLGQFCSNFWLYKFLVHYLQGFFLGTFIWTCHNENKDVIVLERNKEMFDNLFMLLANERFDGLIDEKHDDAAQMFVDEKDIGLVLKQGHKDVFL